MSRFSFVGSFASKMSTEIGAGYRGGDRHCCNRHHCHRHTDPEAFLCYNIGYDIAAIICIRIIFVNVKEIQFKKRRLRQMLQRKL